MSSFSDNDENRKANSGSPDFEFAGLENNAPGSGTDKASGSDVSDFEYGDDSVAGEYDVKESKFFKYGNSPASTDESIGAYYGHETRSDRYPKEEECECYGYETIPEVDYTETASASAAPEASNATPQDTSEDAAPAAIYEPAAEQPAEPSEPIKETAEPAAEQPAEQAYEETSYEESAYEAPVDEAPANEAPAYEEPAYNEPTYEQTAESIFGEREESQADDTIWSYPQSEESGDEQEYEDEDQAYEPEAEENYNDGIVDYDDPNVVTFPIPYQEEAEAEAVRAPSRAKATTILSIAVGAIALTGILGIIAFAIYCDSKKTDPSLITAYPASTTKVAATTTTEEETTTTAETTATPTPEPTNTPSPTPTPEPTNTPVPKKTQVIAPAVKKPKATATPTPTEATEPNNGESGSGSGEGSGAGSGEGSGEVTTGGGSGGTGGSGDTGGGTSGGSGAGGGGSDSTGGGTNGGSGGSGGSGGESGGSSNPPADQNPESNP